MAKAFVAHRSHQASFVLSSPPFPQSPEVHNTGGPHRRNRDFWPPQKHILSWTRRYVHRDSSSELDFGLPWFFTAALRVERKTWIGDGIAEGLSKLFKIC